MLLALFQAACPDENSAGQDAKATLVDSAVNDDAAVVDLDASTDRASPNDTYAPQDSSFFDVFVAPDTHSEDGYTAVDVAVDSNLVFVDAGREDVSITSDAGIDDSVAKDPDVELRGSFRMDSISADVQVRWRDGAIAQIGSSMSINAVTTLQLHSDEAASTGPQEKVLWSMSLPIAEIPLGPIPLDVNLDLQYLAGFDATFSGRASVSSMVKSTFGAEMIVDYRNDPQGEFVLEPFSHSTEVPVSPPTLDLDLAVTARAWTGLQASLNLSSVAVSGGPTLRGVAYFDFNADTARSPWWNINAGIELDAALTLDIFSLSIAFPFPLAQLGGPILAASTQPYHDGSGFAAGGTVRWARTLNKGDIYGDYGSRSVLLHNGDLLVLGQSSALIARLTAWGELLWVRQGVVNINRANVINAFEISDGSLLIFTIGGGHLWLSHISEGGDVLTQTDYNFAYTMSFADVYAVENNGVVNFTGVGQLFDTSIWRAFAARFSFDPRAPLAERVQLVWAKSYLVDAYTIPYADGFNALLPDADNFWVVGFTTDVIRDTQLHGGGALIKLAGDSGDVLLAKTLGTTRGDVYTDIVRAANGDLIVMGRHGQTVYDPEHGVSLQRFGNDGSILGDTTLGEDHLWEMHYYGGPDPGLVLWDEGIAIENAQDGGFVVTGKSGLGASMVTWLAKLDTDLDVEWMIRIDGASEDRLNHVIDVGDGYAVVGTTGNATSSDVFIAKAPYEGFVSFLGASGMQARYVKPDMLPIPETAAASNPPYKASATYSYDAIDDWIFTSSTIHHWTTNPEVTFVKLTALPTP